MGTFPKIIVHKMIRFIGIFLHFVTPIPIFLSFAPACSFSRQGWTEQYATRHSDRDQIKKYDDHNNKSIVSFVRLLLEEGHIMHGPRDRGLPGERPKARQGPVIQHR
jgi:hypothetical protein